MASAALAAESSNGHILLRAAESEYRRILDANPADAYVWAGLARVEELQAAEAIELRASAASHVRQAVALDPNNPVIRRDAGLVLRDLGEIGEAEDQLLAATRLAPYVDAYLDLGALYRDQGQYDLALEQYKSASLLRYAADVQFLLGRAYWEAGQADEAQIAVRTALNLDPSIEDAQSLYERIGALTGR